MFYNKFWFPFNTGFTNTLQILRTSLLLTLLREEKTNKQWLLAIHTVVGKVVYYLAIGLMVILAGVNFYVHLLAPYTIQSSVTLSTGKVSITLSMRDMKGLHLICIILKCKRVFPAPFLTTHRTNNPLPTS